MRRSTRALWVLMLTMAFQAGAPAGHATTPPGDVAMYTGIAEARENGSCNPDGTGTVSGRGLYAPVIIPEDRGPDSTMLLHTNVLAARHGVGELRLCIHLTSSPLPMVTTTMPFPEPGEIDPRDWFWQRNTSCMDSKGYAGRGTILFDALPPDPTTKGDHTVRIVDLSWKVSTAKFVVMLGRWELDSDPSHSGQLVGLAGFQGGAPCFDPWDGATYFTTFGVLSLLESGAHVTWDDVVQPVDPKDGSGPIGLWEPKTRS